MEREAAYPTLAEDIAAELEAEREAEARIAAQDDTERTGISTCDELWRRSMTCYDTMGDAGALAKDAFIEAAQAWRSLAENEKTHKLAAEACAQALEAAEAGWQAAGC